MTHLKWIGSREFSGAGRMRGERSIDLSWLIASAAAAINHHCRQHELRIDKEWSRKPGKTTLAELATILPDLIRAPRVVAHKRRSKVFLREDLAEIVQQENERLGGWHEMPYRKFLDADAVDLLLGDEDTLNVRPAQHECSTDTIAGDSGTQNAQTLHGDAIARPLTIVAAGQSSEQRLRDALNHIEEFYRDSDRYWNATAMAKAYSEATGTNKLVADWLRLAGTKSLMERIAGSMGIPIDQMTDIVTTGSNEHRGTWIHPALVHAFAMWLSQEFYVLVSAHLDTWHKQPESTAIAASQSDSQFVTRDDLVDVIAQTVGQAVSQAVGQAMQPIAQSLSLLTQAIASGQQQAPTVQVRQVNHNTANAAARADRLRCLRSRLHLPSPRRPSLQLA